MNEMTLSQLRDVGDQVSLLAGIFQIKPSYLRAKQIRQADRALVMAESTFTTALAQEAQQWKDAKEGAAVLKNKLTLLENHDEKIAQIQEQLSTTKNLCETWFSMDEGERLRIIQNAKRAHEFLENQKEFSETQTLQRYKKYISLKGLVPYADNANYLCDALYHFENTQKYEVNIDRLKKRMVSAQERLKTVKRGFWMASCFCFLLVTLPICLPFAISLWNRKREIENQYTNCSDLHHREVKRLETAAEGSHAAQEIQGILGIMPLEQIRKTLGEVKSLRDEFQVSEQSSNATALLLNYIDLNRNKLTEIFGMMPDEPLLQFHWLKENVYKFQTLENEIHDLEETQEEIQREKKTAVKGYTKEKLQRSLQNLKALTEQVMGFPFDEENLAHFVEMAVEMPAVIEQTKEVIYHASRGLVIDPSLWEKVKLKLQGFSNTLGLCLLDAEITLRTENAQQLNSESTETPPDTNQSTMITGLENTREPLYETVNSPELESF